jgi:predicted small lipoprotein YifL
MKKLGIAAVAVLTLLSVAGCGLYGKAPVGKAPVVAKY